MKTFILTYDLPSGRIVDEQVFSSSERYAALKESARIQWEQWNKPNTKVLTLFAENREDLFVTHPNYFTQETG